jgi:hypothetical protein
VRSPAVLLLVCLSLVLSSCGTDPNAANAGCDDTVLVGVTAGVTPDFQWWPGCEVNNLVVLEGVGPHTFGQYSATWAIESQPDAQGVPNNRLQSGIQYGETPPSGRQVVAPAPLVQGQPYTVYLNVYTLDQRVVTRGRATFTP